MATRTANLGLVKPALSDIPDIEVINNNMDLIDAALSGASVSGGGTVSPGFSPIVCWGDSLTYGYADPVSGNAVDGASSALLDRQQRVNYPAYLAQLSGRPVINLGVSGETCQTIMARQGADPMVTPAFTIPADTTPVQIGTFGDLYNGGLSTKSGRHATILGYGNSGINPVEIAGVRGYLTAQGQASDRSNTKYYFQRETAGSAVSVPEGTEIETYAMKNLRKGVAVIWMGYNGQFDGPQDMVNKVNAMVEYGNYADFLVVTCRELYADDSYGYYAAAWGKRFLYLKPLLGRIGVQEAGLWSDGALREDGVASELDYDGVHFNSYGCKAIASFIFKRLLENGSLGAATASSGGSSSGGDSSGGSSSGGSSSGSGDSGSGSGDSGSGSGDSGSGSGDSGSGSESGDSSNASSKFESNVTDSFGVMAKRLISGQTLSSGSEYFDTGFALYDASDAVSATVAVKFSGAPAGAFCLLGCRFAANYGDNRGLGVEYNAQDGWGCVMGSNPFNFTQGGVSVSASGDNIVILRKDGGNYGLYVNGSWLYNNASIGSSMSGILDTLSSITLLLGAEWAYPSTKTPGASGVTISDFRLYTSALTPENVAALCADMA